MLSSSCLGILRNVLLPTTHFSLVRKDSSLKIEVPVFRASLCSLDTISRERPLLGDRNCDVMTVAIPSDHKLFLYISDTKRILNMICGRQVRVLGLQIVRCVSSIAALTSRLSPSCRYIRTVVSL